jgi:asparagine synthase (glutamine-hydrolysing)
MAIDLSTTIKQAKDQLSFLLPDERIYIEQFHELTALAIQDRLPPGQGLLGVSMSGGLDSSTLAAKAVAAVGDASRVIADTRYFDHLIPDDERRLSSLVASRLGIRLTLRFVEALIALVVGTAHFRWRF